MRHLLFVATIMISLHAKFRILSCDISLVIVSIQLLCSRHIVILRSSTKK